MQSKLSLKSLLILSLFFLLGLGVSVGSYITLKKIDSDNADTPAEKKPSVVKVKGK